MSYITQSYRKIAVRPAAILTTGYVSTILQSANSDGSTENANLTKENQLVVLIMFTIGSLTDARLKLEFSPDGTNWYQETVALVAESTGTSTESVMEHVYAATGNYRALIPISDRFIRISVKGTGTVAGSSMTVDVVIAKV